jgi:antitoxin MazE
VSTLALERPLKTRLIRIGNSRGLRLPKPLLEQAGLSDEVEITIEDGTLIIAPVSKPRAGWADAARRFGPSELIDAPSSTRFEEEDWAW